MKNKKLLAVTLLIVGAANAVDMGPWPEQHRNNVANSAQGQDLTEQLDEGHDCAGPMQDIQTQRDKMASDRGSDLPPDWKSDSKEEVTTDKDLDVCDAAFASAMAVENLQTYFQTHW